MIQYRNCAIASHDTNATRWHIWIQEQRAIRGASRFNCRGRATCCSPAPVSLEQCTHRTCVSSHHAID